MKRITIWVTATVAALALLVAFQLNATGTGGKTGETGPAVEQSVSPSGSAAPGATKSESDTNDQTGKPGENK